MNALDWAVFVFVVVLTIALIPLTLVIVAWFRSHLIEDLEDDFAFGEIQSSTRNDTKAAKEVKQEIHPRKSTTPHKS